MTENFDIKFNEFINKKKKYINAIIATVIIASVTIMLFFILGLVQITIIVFMLAIIFTIIFGSSIYQINVSFKSQIVSPYFTSINDTLKFNPKGVLNKDLVYDSKVLTKNKGNRYHSSDLLEGNIDGHNFLSADLYIYYTVQSGKSQTTVPVFRGRFYIIDLNYDINGHIVIREESSFFKSKPKGLSLVELECIVFNKKFNIYSNDELNTFKRIKPQQIERLIKLEQSDTGRLLMSIKDDKLYFGFWNNKNYFELSQYKDDLENFKKAANKELELIKQLITIFN